MKANKFFLGLALIGAILTGCDSKVEPTPEDGAGKAYVSVRITMASTADTRATTDGGFAVGTEAEQKINGANSIFLFYDKDGKWVTSGQLQTQAPGADNTVSGGDHGTQVNDRSTDAYIVLSGPDVELKKSTQILTVVNYSNCESLKQLDLVEALEEITTTTSDPANAGFLMSTSVYVKDGKVVNTTAITGENIQPDAATAKTKAVDIYIERASAKAELNINTTDPNFGKLTVANDKGIIVDGELSDVTVAINKWNLNNVYETTYLVKHIDDAW